jgi:hypothetical protein
LVKNQKHPTFCFKSSTSLSLSVSIETKLAVSVVISLGEKSARACTEQCTGSCPLERQAHGLQRSTEVPLPMWGKKKKEFSSNPEKKAHL